MKKILYIFTLLILFLTSCGVNTTSEKQAARVDTLYIRDTVYVNEGPEPLTYNETFHFLDSIDLDDNYDLIAKVIYTADEDECICQEISDRFSETYEGKLLYYTSAENGELMYDNKIIKDREAVLIGTYTYYDDEDWRKITIPMYASKEAWILK